MYIDQKEEKPLNIELVKKEYLELLNEVITKQSAVEDLLTEGGYLDE
jgi:hypothetical protein